jgi:hypothetical protein
VRRLLICLAAGWLAAGAVLADLDAVKAEPNLEKRAKKALENADAALSQAKLDYRNNEFEKSHAALEEVQESVDMAYESLLKTGKKPGNSPGQFKHAELKTRALLRQLEDFRHDMDVADHGALDKVKADVQKVHDDLLLGILERKK